MSNPPLLADPIGARLDGHPVILLDLDEFGALVEHSIAGLDVALAHRLQFSWEGEDIDVRCLVGPSVLQEILSDRLEQLTWHVRATLDTASNPESFRRALAACRRNLDLAQRANLIGDSEETPPSEVMLGAGGALRLHKPGYLTFILRGGKWTSRATRSNEQPIDGFTVAEFEDEQQVSMLKLAYEEADREGRDLIRRFAAASLE